MLLWLSSAIAWAAVADWGIGRKKRREAGFPPFLWEADFY
jgi:hypothetical protein